MGAVDWTFVATDEVKVGDRVSADAGGMPIYRVVAIGDGQAWLQGEGRSGAQRMPSDRFHWRAEEPRQERRPSVFNS